MNNPRKRAASPGSDGGADGGADGNDRQMVMNTPHKRARYTGGAESSRFNNINSSSSNMAHEGTESANAPSDGDPLAEMARILETLVASLASLIRTLTPAAAETSASSTVPATDSGSVATHNIRPVLLTVRKLIADLNAVLTTIGAPPVRGILYDIILTDLEQNPDIQLTSSYLLIAVQNLYAQLRHFRLSPEALHRLEESRRLEQLQEQHRLQILELRRRGGGGSGGNTGNSSIRGYGGVVGGPSSPLPTSSAHHQHQHQHNHQQHHSSTNNNNSNHLTSSIPSGNLTNMTARSGAVTEAHTRERQARREAEEGAFAEWYMRTVTSAFADDLEALREQEIGQDDVHKVALVKDVLRAGGMFVFDSPVSSAAGAHHHGVTHVNASAMAFYAADEAIDLKLAVLHP